MTSCARPGCGHDHMPIRVTYANAEVQLRSDQCGYPDHAGGVCPCLGYRTAEQQRLWNLIAWQIEARLRGRGYQEEKLTDFVRQLLEVYS